MPATQSNAENILFISQLLDQIQLLPKRQRHVMELLIFGNNPLEIAAETGAPVEEVLADMVVGREWLATADAGF